MKRTAPPKKQLSPLVRAIKLAGSEAKLGKLTGFSQVAIHRAKHRGRASAEMAVAIERALEGAVSRAELRPDLFEVAA
ncbi:MAG TPA: YdaS family helix-turn-helix protein [Pseudolabrys sp.]|nr:YdaS family helix-turn-helix protein [Pseudolabrys sp.]